MNRSEWRFARPASDGRHGAAWAFTVAALIAATVVVWRIAPGEQRGGQTLAVSVPAASTPAAAERPS